MEEFPPPSVYEGQETPAEFLARATDGVSHRESMLEELLLLWISNQNPAYAPISELVSDAPLRERGIIPRSATDWIEEQAALAQN